MQTITLRVEDNLIQKTVDMLKSLASNDTNINFSYINELNEVVEVVNNKEYIVPSSKDQEILDSVYDRDEFISFEELKNSICTS